LSTGSSDQTAQPDLIVEMAADDSAFHAALVALDVKATDVNPESFFGTQELRHVVVKASAAIFALIARCVGEKSQLARARAVIVSGKRIEIRGYSETEVINILAAASRNGTGDR
jgi:hypothetical protein